MKCPVCNVGYVHESVNHWCCDYEFCPSYNETDTETYDVLIRTRKALDVLLLTINRLENQNYKDCAWHLRLAIAKIKAIGIADTALEQITALEQKDVK